MSKSVHQKNGEYIWVTFWLYNSKWGNGRKLLRARLCPHGHCDSKRFNIRYDSSNILFVFICLVLSVCVVLQRQTGHIDIAGVYLQSGPIKKTLYFWPPLQVGEHGSVWELTKLSYGITEAGRRRLVCFEEWLIRNTYFQFVPGVSNLYLW